MVFYLFSPSMLFLVLYSGLGIVDCVSELFSYMVRNLMGLTQCLVILYVVHMQSIYCLLCFIFIFKFFVSSVHLLDMHNLCFLDGRLLNVVLFFPCYCLIFNGLSQYFVYSHQMKGALPAQRGARTDDYKVKSLAL